MLGIVQKQAQVTGRTLCSSQIEMVDGDAIANSAKARHHQLLASGRLPVVLQHVALDMASTILPQPFTGFAGGLAAAQHLAIDGQGAQAIGVDDGVVAKVGREDVAVRAAATFEVVVACEAVELIGACAAVQVVTQQVAVASGNVITVGAEEDDLARLSWSALRKECVARGLSLIPRYRAADITELGCPIGRNPLVDDLTCRVVLGVLNCKCTYQCLAVGNPAVSKGQSEA